MSKITMSNDARSKLSSIISSVFDLGAENELLDTIERAYRTSIRDDDAESIRAAVLTWAAEMSDAVAEQAGRRGIAEPGFIQTLRARLEGLADLAPQLAQLKQRGGRFELREAIAPAWAAILDLVDGPITEAG